MHKIKELLHKDSEDTNVSSTSSSSSSESHSHSHSHSHKEGEQLSERAFQHDHVKHGEIEHGAILKEGEIKHSHHEHSHKEHKHLHEGKEKHVYHDREVLKGGDMYREGVDPTLEREVVHTHRHDGGEVRELVGEGKIVKESIKEVELHKVQPVIHREREQKEIRHVVKPEHKFEVKDTQVHHRERDIDLGVRREASTLETSRSLGHAPNIESSREILGKERQHQELPARVEEHVHRKVEEHVHPVVYKEVLKPKVTEETHHIYEKVKEAPVETYEVKEIDRSRGASHSLSEAEREFFARESSRGITMAEGHQHHHEHSHKLKEGKIKDKSHKKHKAHKSHKHSHKTEVVDIKREPLIETHTHSHTTFQEPLIGHHQNIGGHHLAAGAVPAGHNTAYDAALCNECTDNSICSHSARDATLMQKMNEKKIVKDEKLAEKQSKKLSKQQQKSSVV